MLLGMNKYQLYKSKIIRDFVSTSPASEVEDTLTSIGWNPYGIMTVNLFLQPVVIHLHSHFFVGSGGSIAFIKNPLNDCSIHSVDSLRQLHEFHNCQICHPVHRSGVAEFIEGAYRCHLRRHHHSV